MAGKSNIKISVTTDEKGAVAGLKNLDDQVGKTGGGIGKLGKAAAVGGAALVAVGIKSVMAFEDLGLSVGKLSDATGLTTEEASRLMEVGDDLGISSETLSSSIGKMSKQLGANKDAFKEYGIEIQKNADGTTNVNETFLKSVDAMNQIQDPLKKSEAAAKVFGKSWAQMGELIGESSDKIRTDLAAVSDQKVFDDKKVQDARDMRDAFDSIVDAGQDLMLTIGSALAPVITKLAPTLTKVVEAAGPLAEALGEVLGAALETIGPIIEGLLPLITVLAKGLALVAEAIALIKPTGLTKDIKELGVSFDAVRQQAADAGISTDEFAAMMKAAAAEVVPTGDGVADTAAAVEILKGKLDEASASTESAAGSMEHMGIVGQDAKSKIQEQSIALGEAARQAGEAQRNTDNLAASWELLKGTLSDQQSWIDVQNSFADVKTAGEEAFKAAADKTADADQKARDYQSALIGLKQKVIDYAGEVGGLPPEVVSKILADIDEGSVATADQILDRIGRERQVIYNAQVAGHREFAAGTNSAPAGTAWVGERGPELVKFRGGEKVFTAGQSAAMMAGAPGGTTIIVQQFIAGSVQAERDLVRAVYDGFIDGQARGELVTAP